MLNVLPSLLLKNSYFKVGTCLMTPLWHYTKDVLVCTFKLQVHCDHGMDAGVVCTNGNGEQLSVLDLFNVYYILLWGDGTDVYN